ncbi:hypothetical protein JCM11491_005336 [Sporobolomyces phaffii]
MDSRTALSAPRCLPSRNAWTDASEDFVTGSFRTLVESAWRTTASILLDYDKEPETIRQWVEGDLADFAAQFLIQEIPTASKKVILVLFCGQEPTEAQLFATPEPPPDAANDAANVLLFCGFPDRRDSPFVLTVEKSTNKDSEGIRTKFLSYASRRSAFDTVTLYPVFLFALSNEANLVATAGKHRTHLERALISMVHGIVDLFHPYNDARIGGEDERSGFAPATKSFCEKDQNELKRFLPIENVNRREPRSKLEYALRLLVTDGWPIECVRPEGRTHDAVGPARTLFRTKTSLDFADAPLPLEFLVDHPSLDHSQGGLMRVFKLKDSPAVLRILVVLKKKQAGSKQLLKVIYTPGAKTQEFGKEDVARLDELIRIAKVWIELNAKG